MLRFMLQPIVENSLLHGFDTDLGENCVIAIRSRFEGGMLVVCVEDNGTGIAQENPSIYSLSLHAKTHFSGIGLANIQSRLKMQFGEAYGMALSNLPKGGLKVSISLPCIRFGN